METFKQQIEKKRQQATTAVVQAWMCSALGGHVPPNAREWVQQQLNADTPDEVWEKIVDPSGVIQPKLNELLQMRMVGDALITLRRFAEPVALDQLDGKTHAGFEPLFHLFRPDQTEVLKLLPGVYYAVPRDSQALLLLCFPKLEGSDRLNVHPKMPKEVMETYLARMLVDRWQQGADALATDARRFLCGAVQMFIGQLEQGPLDPAVFLTCYARQKHYPNDPEHFYEQHRPTRVLIFSEEKEIGPVLINDPGTAILLSEQGDPSMRSTGEYNMVECEIGKRRRLLGEERISSYLLRLLKQRGFDQGIVLTKDNVQILLTHERYVDPDWMKEHLAFRFPERFGKRMHEILSTPQTPPTA